MPDRIVALCRAGFEKECAAELQHHANDIGRSAYIKTEPSSAFVQLIFTDRLPAESLFELLAMDDLIFTRQWFAASEPLTDLPERDRLTPLQAAITRLGIHFSGLELDWPDTNEGKSISKFCRQFGPHLQRAFRDRELIRPNAKYQLHLMFLDSTTVFVGFVDGSNSATHAMGIPRLKMPHDAPSRSTLKLEEAFDAFIDAEESRHLIKAGMRAVDLGAAPGGWTWQLIKRGMLVAAVDNGPMDDAVMDSGLVDHIREDAFRWTPDKPVDWLVCDMVEKPMSVTRMILRWFREKRCQNCIFNLKLPMNKRFQSIVDCLTLLHEELDVSGSKHILKARQLYHDREEITVYLRRAIAADHIQQSDKQ